MEATQSAFGVLFENILDFPLINAAKTVFEDAKAPCVFTLEQNRDAAQQLRSAFNNMTVAHHGMIELSYLAGEDVAQFADEHWHTCHPGEVGPFEREGVRHAFSDRPRPIGKARVLLARLHIIKDRFEAADPPWDATKILEILPQVLLEEQS
jgi:hypothetical protein